MKNRSARVRAESTGSAANDEVQQEIGVGSSSSQDTRPIAATSLADWQARFTCRSSLSPADATRVAECGPHLRRRYNQQLQRAKIQFVDPRLKLSSCQPLVRLARETASVSQLVYEALRSLDDVLTVPAVVVPETVEAAIEWNDRQIDRIAWQLQALDAADTQSAWLRALFGQLESCARVSAAGWRTLAQQMLAAANVDPGSDSVWPLPGLALTPYLTEIGQGRYAEVMGRGIETARIVAWMLARRMPDEFDPELLTLAALCQDCGLLLLRRSRSGKRPPISTQQLRQLHPSIGAGLIAALVEFSTELPALVAQHHRRLNELQGTPDFPGRDQNRGSRLLAVVVRLLELVDEWGPMIADSERLAGRRAFFEPARRLAREALRGDWDRSLAGDLLDRLGFSAECESLRQAVSAAAAFESRDGVHRRLDSGDEPWPQTNLELPNLELPNLELEPSREKRYVRASAR